MPEPTTLTFLVDGVERTVFVDPVAWLNLPHAMREIVKDHLGSEGRLREMDVEGHRRFFKDALLSAKEATVEAAIEAALASATAIAVKRYEQARTRCGPASYGEDASKGS